MKTGHTFRRLAAALLLLAAAQAQAKDGAIPHGQPADERAAQEHLPMAHDALWAKFLKCKVGYNEKSGMYSITVTPELKAMAGQPVVASGWVMPLDGSDQTKHFLLTRRTPVCMFCPPGEPNEVAEVVTLRPVAWTDKQVTVIGLLSLINNGEKGMFFRIDAYSVK
ncbi:MAG TPA: DUF3299 domain-containing protein [Rhizomicrobium sp.]|nr:DUF3299 domain-containing protein [Rhizomicrobium sp.]